MAEGGKHYRLTSRLSMGLNSSAVITTEEIGLKSLTP